jgi:hypothetical protein
MIKFIYNYRLHKADIDSFSNLNLTTPIDIEMTMTTITDKRFFYITLTVDRMEINNQIRGNIIGDDDIFIDTKNKFIYFIGAKEYSIYDTSSLINFIQSEHNKYVLNLKNYDSLEITLNDTLNSIIKPFPSYPTFKKGIFFVKKKNFYWSLLKSEELNFSFYEILNKIKDFKFINTTYKFPYI